MSEKVEQNIISDRFIYSNYRSKLFNQNKECKEMHNITSCVLKTLHHLPRAISSSGHFAFQYGRYEDCIQSQDQLYHMIEFNVFNATNGITMGICLPKECSHNLVSKVLTQAFKLSGLPVSIYRVVTNPQEYDFPFTWVFYLTISLIILFALLVAIASLQRKRQGWYKGFSLQENIKILRSNSQEKLNVLNGVRALTMMWIVMGNTFINSIIGAVNVLTIDFVFARPFILIIETTLLTADIFFFLGGFFLAYKFAQDIINSIGKFPLAIFQKILRILPAYIVTILIWYSVFMHLGSGPRWIVNEEYTSLCKNMWRTVLFVDNLVNNGHTLCMSWAFYMQIQFQIFLVTVALLFIYSKSRLFSLIAAAGLAIYSWTINLIYTQEHGQKYPISFQALATYQNYIFDVFIKPQYRWTPYFFGMFVGLAYSQFINQTKNKQPSSIGFMKASLGRKVALIRQILTRKRNARRIIEWSGMAIMAFVTFFPRVLQVGYEWPQDFHSLCLNFGRILYPFSILLVCLPSMLGIKGSFFRTILDTFFFNFFAKISYGVYLVHGMVILYLSGTKRHDTYLTITDVYIGSLSVLTISLFFGFLLSVIIQLPCRYITKNILQTIKGEMEDKNDQSQSSLLSEGFYSEKCKLSGSTTEPVEINCTLPLQKN